MQIGDIEIHAQLLPEEKVHILQELKKTGTTAMVGDGINDAPALAAADVGIAMGVAGSAVAMETADVALMTNDLRKLAIAVELGRDCRWKIGQNVTLSFVTKIAIIGLAASGYASLWTAVLADVGTCLLVIFNSMRLLKHKSCQDHCCTATKKVKNSNHHAMQYLSTEPAVNMVNLEGRLVDLCNEASIRGPLMHGHRGKFSWLKNCHGHSHHSHLNELDQHESGMPSKGFTSSSSSSKEVLCGAQQHKGKDMEQRSSSVEEGGCGPKCMSAGPHITRMPKLACSSRPDKAAITETPHIRLPKSNSEEECCRQEDLCSIEQYPLPDVRCVKVFPSYDKLEHHHPPGGDEGRRSPRGFPLNESAWRDAGFTNLDINEKSSTYEPNNPTEVNIAPNGLAVLSSLEIFAMKLQAAESHDLRPLVLHARESCCGSKLAPISTGKTIDLTPVEDIAIVTPILELDRGNDIDVASGEQVLQAINTSAPPEVETKPLASLCETAPSSLATLNSSDKNLIEELEKEDSEDGPKKNTPRHLSLKHSASDTDLPTLNSIRHPHPTVE